MPESRAQTRYSETDSLEVLVLRSIQYDSEQKAGVLSLLSGKEIVLPLNRSALSRSEWRSRTKELMQEIVYVRPSEAPTQISRKRLQRYGLQHRSEERRVGKECRARRGRMEGRRKKQSS